MRVARIRSFIMLLGEAFELSNLIVKKYMIGPHVIREKNIDSSE